MTNTSIPTEYNGILFRSRLEAAWAFLFDIAGVQYEYENDAFEGYLPDFKIADVGIRLPKCTKEYLYIEVKGVMSKHNAEQIAAFAKDNPTLIVGAFPEGSTVDELWDSIADLSNSIKWKMPRYNLESVDGDCYTVFPCIAKDGTFTLLGDGGDLYLIDEAKTEAMWIAARNAYNHRFRWMPPYAIEHLLKDI